MLLFTQPRFPCMATEHTEHVVVFPSRAVSDAAVSCFGNARQDGLCCVPESALQTPLAANWHPPSYGKLAPGYRLRLVWNSAPDRKYGHWLEVDSSALDINTQISAWCPKAMLHTV
jgi:hypothetical protein